MQCGSVDSATDAEDTWVRAEPVTMSIRRIRPGSVTGTAHLVIECPPGLGLTGSPYRCRANKCGESTVTDVVEHLTAFTHATWLGREGYAAWTKAIYHGHLPPTSPFALENDLPASTHGPNTPPKP
jgi:hypothetical protein